MTFLLNPYAFSTASGAIGTTPTFVATGAADSSLTTVAPAYPAGIQSDDILILSVWGFDSSGSATVVDPAGWTAVLPANRNSSNFHASALYWKRATGSESGTVSVTFSESLNLGGALGVISAWRGCTTSGTPFERANFYMQHSTTAMQGKGLSTAGINRRVVCFTFGHGSATSGSNTNGWTEDYEGNANPGTGVTASINSTEQATAGKVAPCTRTMAVIIPHSTFTLALVPANATAGAADSYADVFFQGQFTGANGSTTFTDESHYNHGITIGGNAQIQSNKLELDGTGDWIRATTSVGRQLWRFFTDDQFSTPGDFTLDVWDFQIDNLATTRYIASFFESASNNRGWQWYVATTGNIGFSISTDGSTVNTMINYAAGITAGVSYNLRIVRSVSAGEIYLYINGTKVATGTFSGASNVFNSSTAQLCIGGVNPINGTAISTDGRLSAFRAYRGAKTTGASYTVETLPLATS